MFLAVFPIVSKILDATAETLPAMLQQIRDLGYTMQISADTLKPTLDGVYTIAVNQNAAINNAFIFLYLGLDVVVSAVCIALLAFVNVEKTISFKQQVIRERLKANVPVEGGMWIEPEEQERLEQQAAEEEFIQIHLKEIEECCASKGIEPETDPICFSAPLMIMRVSLFPTIPQAPLRIR